MNYRTGGIANDAPFTQCTCLIEICRVADRRHSRQLAKIFGYFWACFPNINHQRRSSEDCVKYSCILDVHLVLSQGSGLILKTLLAAFVGNLIENIQSTEHWRIPEFQRWTTICEAMKITSTLSMYLTYLQRTLCLLSVWATLASEIVTAMGLKNRAVLRFVHCIDQNSLQSFRYKCH